MYCVGTGVGKSALVIMFVLDHFPGDLGPIIEGAPAPFTFHWERLDPNDVPLGKEDSYRKQCLTNDGVALLEVSDIISGHDEFK